MAQQARRLRAGARRIGRRNGTAAACRSRFNAVVDEEFAAHRRGRRRQGRHPHARRGDHPRRTAPTCRRRNSCAASSPARTPGASSSASRAAARIWPAPSRAPTRHGNKWVINGQKVWTTSAHKARLGPAAGARRLGRAQAQGARLFHPRHEAARRAGPPAEADERPCLVQPGVLHRRRGRSRR